MYFSIPQALSFSLFGIPMFGVDTCGFNGNTDMELCARWMQLSAFFPFYRNHNTLSAIDQEAYVWAEVATATRTAMAIRFRLLPYLYTLFYQAHTSGDTVMRALAWEFPDDPSLAAADRQFFLGPAVLVTPVLTPGASSVDGVFPGLTEGNERYFDWYTLAPLAVSGGKKNTTLAAPLGHIPVHLRGGHVLAMQQRAMTTRDARTTAWSVLVAPGVDGTATGALYLDDGVSVAPNATKTVNLTATLNGDEGVVLSVAVSGSYTGLDTPLANVTVLGVMGEPSGNVVRINGKKVGQSVYNATSKTLTASDLDQVLGGKAWGASWNVTFGK